MKSNRFLIGVAILASASAACAVAPGPKDIVNLLDKPRITVPISGNPIEFDLALDEMFVTRKDGSRGFVKLQSKAKDGASLYQQLTQYQRSRGEVASLILYPPAQKHDEYNSLILMKRIVVQVEKGTEIKNIAAQAGVKVSEKRTEAPELYMLEAEDSFVALAALARLSSSKGVTYVQPELGIRVEPRYIPVNDPYSAQQWHLINTGQGGALPGIDLRIATVPNLGNGIRIGIIDDGLQTNHPDLVTNVDNLNDFDFVNNDNDPSPLLSGNRENPNRDSYHGTLVAGVAAARGFNNTGICGVAPLATLVGLRIWDYDRVTTNFDLTNAFIYRSDIIDIKVGAWGPLDDGQRKGFYDTVNGTFMGIDLLEAAALQRSVLSGRKGLGTIFVWGAGNGAQFGDNSNYDPYANSIYTIAVGAITDQGVPANYSEPGTNIVVCAPSGGGANPGIVTTDLTGNDGLNYVGASGDLIPPPADARNYTRLFGTGPVARPGVPANALDRPGTPVPVPLPNGRYSTFPYLSGTSAAAPMVAGVVALMLEANPKLNWRDVQDILISTARQLNPTDTGWQINTAGFHFHPRYGAGLVDASAAVTYATAYKFTTTQRTATATIIGNAILDAIPDEGQGVSLVKEFVIPATIARAEHVVCSFNINHERRGDLAIELKSPTGIISRLADLHDDTLPNYRNYPFMSVIHWGENPAGKWTLTITDRKRDKVGSLLGATLKIFGSGNPNVPPPAGGGVASAGDNAGGGDNGGGGSNAGGGTSGGSGLSGVGTNSGGGVNGGGGASGGGVSGGGGATAGGGVSGGGVAGGGVTGGGGVAGGGVAGGGGR